MFDIKFIAHRGHGPTSSFSGNGQSVPAEICPENTLKAFREAVRQQADGIEFDIHLTKDGDIVVIHDDELNKNVEGADRDARDLGLISEKSLAEVKTYNVGQGERIPTLRESLDYFVEANLERKNGGLLPLIINLELKGKGTIDHVPLIINDYVARGVLAANDFVFCSFDHESLAQLKAKNPHFQISLSLRTKTLFGAENVVIPGWHTKPGAEYDPAGLTYLRQFHRTHGCTAMDPVLWDIYKPFIDMAKTEKFAIHASTSDLRIFDSTHLVPLLAASRDVQVYFKTDEPAKARDALHQLINNIDNSTANQINTVVSTETVTDENLNKAPVRDFWDRAKNMFDRALQRPISQRPVPHSSVLQHS